MLTACCRPLIRILDSKRTDPHVLPIELMTLVFLQEERDSFRATIDNYASVQSVSKLTSSSWMIIRMHIVERVITLDYRADADAHSNKFPFSPCRSSTNETCIGP
jgi:hypothetical protein